jgi:hypothetical protein
VQKLISFRELPKTFVAALCDLEQLQWATVSLYTQKRRSDCGMACLGGLIKFKVHSFPENRNKRPLFNPKTPQDWRQSAS